ncbi:gram-negative porin family protein [Janthinobacterium agaricidamnosum NBRC 102515 = DSM 9628]|uniref:Gram-negative porin family protein n=1 Tax=Janthinobacterium agaricidamnosum NBRC 102515 = DSM 9628 TaxID=1349767 RepID=W0VAZ9_9BURK|nr:gram-negative porin family protein [Janthinobacterium agaricidamnosum NBRC 102515 = DSM 9628]
MAGFAASAQAQSNVTIYGLIDLGLAKTTGQSTVERENNASRLGFKGTEELGGGLSAIFNLENEILADTGAQKGVFFERQAYVGLKGGFGTAILGRTKNLIDGTIARVDPFNTYGVIGKNNEALLRSGVGSSRVNNAITFNSPSFDGVVGSVQYVLSETPGGSNGALGLLTYDNGPISLHGGYEQVAQTVASTVKPNLWSLGGAYKFGPAKVTAAYTKGDTKVATTGDFRSYLVGLIYTAGNGDAKASYGKQQQSSNKVSDLDIYKEYGVGYDYHLSKRTDLYAYAGREQVKSLTSYQIGIAHKF